MSDDDFKIRIDDIKDMVSELFGEKVKKNREIKSKGNIKFIYST